MAFENDILNEIGLNELSEDDSIVERSHALTTYIHPGLKKVRSHRNHVEALEVKLHLPLVHEKDVARALYIENIECSPQSPGNHMVPLMVVRVT